MIIHPNLKLLSHHSDSMLEECARKFQLYKMTPDPRDSGKVFSDAEETVDLDFGSVVGIGVQEYLATNSLEKSVWKMFLSWNQNLDEEAGVLKKKSFWHSLWALDRFIDFRQTELQDYEMVFFDDKAAVELGFSIQCPEGFTERGKLDCLLRSKSTKRFATLECKTTGSSRLHEAMYKNSGQGLGYSLVVDTIAARIGELNEEAYEVIYIVYTTGNFGWTKFPFLKSHTQRAKWIKNILLRIKKISDYVEEDYFPMNGDSCFKFFRPCKWFDICEMSDKVLIGSEEKIVVKKDKEEDYQFKFDLMEVIDAQLAKSSSSVEESGG